MLTYTMAEWILQMFIGTMDLCLDSDNLCCSGVAKKIEWQGIFSDTYIYQAYYINTDMHVFRLSGLLKIRNVVMGLAEVNYTHS